MNQSFVQKLPFGHLPDGRAVTQFVLTNQKGMEMRVMDYGCTITSLNVPDRAGQFDDVVLGFETLDEYLHSPHYVGCIIGRCAGRIANGSLNINDKTYHLSINQPPHHLHGGVHGFHTKIWNATPYANAEGTGITFSYVSPEGEEGYPGNVIVDVRYFLSHDNAVLFQYSAHTDMSSVINLTQHTYFNLNGGRDTILKHGLAINSDEVLPVNDTKTPTGEIQPVEDTVFDFRQPTLLGHVLLQHSEVLRSTKGLDHCFVIRKGEKALSHAAILMDVTSARRMDVFTTEPGLQVYTGNDLEGRGKRGLEYGPYSGIALETQHFPDAPHHAGFPSILLHPGERYESATLLKFSVIGNA